jgi:hypothetical protein
MGPDGGGFAKDNYGDSLFQREIKSPLTHLRDIGEQHFDSSVKVRAWIQNARMQGKKMAFVELREEESWSIQGLVLANGTDVSREMVKWVDSLNPESFVSVEATVKRPIGPVKSCRVTNYELHLSKVFCEAPAPEVLGLSLAAANKAVTGLDDEEAVDHDGLESPTGKDSAVPGASLATHISNPVMHKRAPATQAISDVRMTVRKLFTEYLDVRGFKQFEPPCLIGAASEGGAEVLISCFTSSVSWSSGAKTRLNSSVAFTRPRPSCCPSPAGKYESHSPTGQKLLREEGPGESRNVPDDEDMSTPQEKALGAIIREKYQTDFYIIDKFPSRLGLSTPCRTRRTLPSPMRSTSSCAVRRSSLVDSVSITPWFSRTVSELKGSILGPLESRSISTSSNQQACHRMVVEGLAWTGLSLGTSLCRRCI